MARKINGFQPACEGCGWQGVMLPTRALALEAARDHEYMRGCPAKGELSPTFLQQKAADVVKQQVGRQRMRNRRDWFMRRGR